MYRFFFIEIHIFFNKDALNWSNGISKDINNVIKYLYFYQKVLKNVLWFKKILKITTVFNIDNNKCFLSNKSAYSNNYWRIKTGVMTLITQLYISGINYILKYIQTENSYFEM